MRRLFIALVTEVFSTDWSFGGGQDECRFGDGANSLRAQSDAVERLPAGLEQGDRAFALGAQTADELVAGEVVRVQVAALGRRQHAGTGAVVALVGQAGQTQQGGRGVQCAEEPGDPGGGEVVGRAGLDVGDRHRKTGGVTDDLHVAAMGSGLAGIPQVMTGHRLTVRQRAVRMSVPSSVTWVQPAAAPAASTWCRSGAWAASTSMPSCR